MFFENITIKPTTNEAWFQEKVDEMIALKANKADTIFLEKEIDEKIYDLYELTDSERSFIVKNVAAATFSEDSISAISSSVSE